MSEDSGGVADGRLIQKTFLSRLLAPEDLERVEDAVQRMHAVVQAAYALGKLVYLRALDDAVATNGGRFDREVAAAMAARFPLVPERFEDWLDVASTDPERRRGRPCKSEKQARLVALNVTYQQEAALGRLPVDKTPLTNLSFAKAFEATKMATAYRNNVYCHFDKYIHRLLRVSFIHIQEVSLGRVLTKPERKECRKTASRVSRHILEGRDPLATCPPLFVPWVAENVAWLTPELPGANPTWRYEQLKTYPERWLPFMVAINRKLEEYPRQRLFRPLPTRTSFIPGHIRLDTQGLVDILIASDKGAVTRRILEPLARMPFPSSTGGAGPSQAPPYRFHDQRTTLTKLQLWGSLDALLHPDLAPTVSVNPGFHAAHYRTSIWRCLTTLGCENVPTNIVRHRRTESGQRTGDEQALVFGNVIDTDGFSVSMHYVAPALYGKTQFNGGLNDIKKHQRAQATAEKDAGGTYVTKLSEEGREALLRSSRPRAYADPGKGVLLTVTDGRRVIKYTRAHRDADSGAGKRRDVLRLKLRASIHPGVTSTFGDVQKTLGGARSTITAQYCQYLSARQTASAHLRPFYSRRMHRRHRYQAYVGRKRSEDRFFSLVQETFGRDVVIFYGNWGQNPNLRNQPPSPGINLRRRLASRFKVYLVDERYTSSVCPACDTGNLLHPRSRLVVRRSSSQGARLQPIHHLLKCPNPKCCTVWWHRDILGALNIRCQAEHALHHGVWHPKFTPATE